MKKIVLIFIAVFCTLSMTSCSKKINNEFFGKDTLSNYALSLSFPNPNADTSSLVGDENLFVYLTEVEYKSYSKSVYDYLANNSYYYVGTYEQNGLIAEMLPKYAYKSIDDSYDFAAQNHNFIYSTVFELHESGSFHYISPCYQVQIERVEETKYNLFSSKTYNTIIRLSNKLSVCVETD